MKKTTWIASCILLLSMGQTGAFAQDIRIDMNKAYPEKTISLQKVAEVKYIPLETTDESLINDLTFVEISDKFIFVYQLKIQSFVNKFPEDCSSEEEHHFSGIHCCYNIKCIT